MRKTTVVFFLTTLFFLFSIFSTAPFSEEEVSARPTLFVTNVHEHIQSEKEAEKLLRVMDRLGIERTLLVGSPRATLFKQQTGFHGYEDNNGEVIAIARRWPDRFIAFVTLNPRNPNKLAKLRENLSQGAKGVKLYSGHKLFYDLPLNDPRMDEIYEFCEKNNVPVLFHVNTGYYLSELEEVIRRYPKLKINCPHFCLSSINLERLDYLLKTYPNLWTDISFGAPEFLVPALRRISRNPAKYQEIIQKYPDRFLFGTDTVITRAGYKTELWLTQVLGVYRDLLEKKSYRFFLWEEMLKEKGGDPDRNNELKGLNLKQEILEKIYRDNANDFLG